MSKNRMTPRERLIELRDVVLPSIPPDRLDMESWSNDCGTVRCLGGWACAHPRFVADGLELVEPASDGMWVPQFGDTLGWEALEWFFGLSKAGVNYIFRGEPEQLHEEITAAIAKLPGAEG